MSRVRYFVDRPRGPRGGNNDSGPYYTLHTAKRHAAKTDDVVGYQGRLIRPARCEGTILAVDLDELKPYGVDSDREFEWHESRMQYHAAEAQRLRPGAELKTAEQFLTHEDLAELRELLGKHFEAIKGRHRTWPLKGMRDAQVALEKRLRELLDSGKLGGRR